MSEDKLFAIISEWSQSYGDRFRKSNRLSAIEQLMDLLVEAGFDKYAIKAAKQKILFRTVGKRSKFGAQALREWKEEAEDDFNRAWAHRFVNEDLEEIVPVAPVEPQAPAYQDPPSLPDGEIDAEYSDEAAEKKTYRDDVGDRVAPEMDRSMFEGIETSPVESIEDFMKNMGIK